MSKTKRYVNINRENFLALAHERYPDAANDNQAVAAIGKPMGFTSSHMWQIINGTRNVSISFVAGMELHHGVIFDPSADNSIYVVTEN